MSTKIKCANCGKDLDIRGVRLHMATKHPEFVQISTNNEQFSTNTDAQTRTNANVQIEQTAQLAEQTGLFEQNESLITRLSEDVASKQAELEASYVRIAELEASLAEHPQSIEDFSTEEKNTYFNQLARTWSNESSAKFAEEAGFKVTREVVKTAEIAEKTPLALTYPHIVLTYNGKPIGALVKR